MALNDVIVALRSLSTTAEFLISLGLLQNWRKLDVAEFIAALFYEKIWLQNATDVFGSLILPGHTGGAYNMDRIGIPEK